MEFTEFIKKRRDVLDLTQEDLAKRLGTATAYVGLMELGKRRPKKVTSLEKLRTALEIEEQDSGWFFRFITYAEQPDYGQKYLSAARLYQTPPASGIVLSEESPVYQALSAAIEHPDVNPEHLRQILLFLQTPGHPFSRIVNLLLGKSADILEMLLERLRFELQLLEKKCEESKKIY